MAMFDSLSGLEKGVQAAWLRNSTILNNVANNDTPNFKSSGVEFEEIYKKAVSGAEDDFVARKTRATHIDFGETVTNPEAAIVKRDSTTYRQDGNNVDIDQEMTDYAKNYIFYNSLLRKVNGQFNQLNAAIKGQ